MGERTRLWPRAPCAAAWDPEVRGQCRARGPPAPREHVALGTSQVACWGCSSCRRLGWAQWLESTLSFPSGGAVGTPVALGHRGQRRDAGKECLGESQPIQSQPPAFLKPFPTSLGWPWNRDPQVRRCMWGDGGQCLVEPLVIRREPPALKRDRAPFFRPHPPLGAVSTLGLQAGLLAGRQAPRAQHLTDPYVRCSGSASAP